MSELEGQFVYRGRWTDWERGSIMGKTITTDSQTGNLIVSLLAVLGTIAASQLWQLTAFLYYQIRAKGTPSDGLFWQQQALIRTLSTPSSMAADAVRLAWAWRHKTSRVVIRSCIPSILAILFAVITTTGSIFTSYIVSSSSQDILVRSPHCGRLNYTRIFSPDNDSLSIWGKLNSIVQGYSNNCYGKNNTDLPVQCHSTFTKPNIPFTQESTACPWATDTLCTNESLPALALDTGLVNMNSQFGLNLPRQDGVKARKRTTCNIIPLTNHTIIKKATDVSPYLVNPDVLPDERFLFILLKESRNTSAVDVQKALFMQSLEKAKLVSQYESTGHLRYASSKLPQDFEPRPEMLRDDADTALNVIWTNAVPYIDPVNDPIFAAHRVSSFLSVVDRHGNTTVHLADHPGGVVGCMEQYQFCITQQGKEDLCTALEGLPAEPSGAMYASASSVQLAILQLLIVSLLGNDITTGAVDGYLQASSQVVDGLSAGLPDDQWKREVIGWEAYALAALQTWVANYAIGPMVSSPEAANFTDRPATPGEQLLCQAMKMRKAGGFVNINVFGLAFMITFTSLITIVNLVLLRVLVFFSRFRQVLAPRIDRWVNDGIFQLQRRAFEAEGKGDWWGLQNDIPITKTRVLLRELQFEATLN